MYTWFYDEDEQELDDDIIEAEEYCPTTRTHCYKEDFDQLLSRARITAAVNTYFRNTHNNPFDSMGMSKREHYNGHYDPQKDATTEIVKKYNFADRPRRIHI